MIDEKKLINNLIIRREKLRYISIVALHNNMNYVDTIINEINSIIDIINEQPKVGEWIPFIVDGDENLECPLPNEEQEILISNGRRVWVDTLMYDYYDNGEYYFDNYDCDLIGCAWQPLPEPWEGE